MACKIPRVARSSHRRRAPQPVGNRPGGSARGELAPDHLEQLVVAARRLGARFIMLAPLRWLSQKPILPSPAAAVAARRASTTASTLRCRSSSACGVRLGEAPGKLALQHLADGIAGKAVENVDQARRPRPEPRVAEGDQ